MTSREIRQSFLGFFRSKQHTIVPSSSLLPDSPNLLFTNAGMNQFVPIFLGQAKCPYTPGRAADTQKCIRAGGKHNDLEDVGLDTYHHTFFEMLGNWSFGDYFKKEAIEWAWELVTEVWKFPRNRLYATVYQPDKAQGDPSEFDQEAYDHWARLFSGAGLDPQVHVRTGGKKDNFWMMGETGPCGPCSELHVDLTPRGDTGGLLVNQGSAQCIEIWNLVFMQFNANPDGTYSPLPAKSVDTGMGFERVTSILQCTKQFTDFSGVISNYETDIFRPIFDQLERLSGKRYGSTLPSAESEIADLKSQIATDVAFRVIADHLRTLSFAIADGIQPGNTDRNYVLRRILRRAVRYGRSLGFHEPFFGKLVGVLADTMGDVFPEIRAKQNLVEQVIRTEEEAFNKTLDRGIALFDQEVARLIGSAPAPGAADRAPAVGTVASDDRGAKYSRRHLPHFERPWGKYMVTFCTREKRQLTPAERDIVLESILHAHQHRQYQLFAACVMPDHVHLLFEPQIKELTPDGKPVFHPLGEILHGIKSTTAHRINKAAEVTGVHVWEEESFDRLMRGDSELEEKFHYICRNPWDNGVVPMTDEYRWLWTPGVPQSGVAPAVSREGAGNSARGGRAPRIPAAFAFRLYDEQGFPLDLTELMARERGLTVDVEGFNRLMEEQRERARAAQKKEVIELAGDYPPTEFVGFDTDEADCRIEALLTQSQGKGGTEHWAVVTKSPLYAEMGGQVGDRGLLYRGGSPTPYQVLDTIKKGSTFYLKVDASGHAMPGSNQPWPIRAGGEPGRLVLDKPRRAAIQRHHTVTHLLHWALHEVVSRDASQKGSFVGPDKLTFDFNHAPLTPQQVRDVEKLVNERILDNAPVSWVEMKYNHVKDRPDVMQFFGDKYGEWVRVVQIGGKPAGLDGYSMELCGGTHTRATGEIGLFRIVSEAAIAAGVRRIEAVAGLEAWRRAGEEVAMLKTVAERLATPVVDLDKKIENLLAQQKELEKQVKLAMLRNASNAASELLSRAHPVNGTPLICHNLGDADGDFLQAIADSLKSRFQGVVVLGGASANAVALVATVSADFTAKVQAGKIIQQIAPMVGGRGGGRPDNARGGGKDVSKLDEALARARSLLG